MEGISFILIIILTFLFHILKNTFSLKIKRIISLFILLILFPVFVQATETKIFEGYIFSEQSITVDDRPFIIRFDYSLNTIMLDYNKKYYFVPLGECKTIMNLKFCYGSYLYDTDIKKNKVNISVYSVKPEIKISRIADKTALRIGEEAEISVNITNGIGISAENFIFTDTFPKDEFYITAVSGDCFERNNTIYYSGYLRENSKIKCSYKIKPIKETIRSVRARVRYYDGFEVQELFSNPLNFDVSPFLSIITEFNESDNKVAVGEEFLFIINLTNNDEDYDSFIKSLDIFIPSGIEYVSTATVKRYLNSTSTITIRSQNIQKEDNKLHFEGELEKNSTKFIVLKLKALMGGSSNIFIYATYNYNGFNSSTEIKKTIEVEKPDINIYTNFQDGEQYDSGQESLIKIDVINPNNIINLKNILVKIDTPLYEFPIVYLEELNKTSTTNAVYTKIIMPSVSSNKDFDFNVTLFYETEFGQKLNKTFNYKVYVKIIEGLVVSHEFSKTSAEGGEEITIKTNVENKRNVDVKDVRVFDVVPLEFIRKGLNSVSNLQINALEKVTAYEYKVILPKVANVTKYKIRTVARYSEDNKTYAYETEDYITVEKKKLELSISNAITDTKPFMGAIIDVLYTITNNEEEILKDIVAYFPVQEDIELVGEKNFSIENLGPGESYTIRNAHKIRAKTNGSLTLKPTLFVYKDEEGNIYETNSTSLSLSPEFGYIAGPAFVIEQNAPQRVRSGDKIVVYVSVKNIGTEEGIINISNNKKYWLFELKPEQADSFFYTLETTTPGHYSINPLKGEYYYIGKKIYTLSNSQEVIVFKEEMPLTEEKKEQEEEVVSEQHIEKKSFFKIVIETVKNIFSSLRRR